MKIVASAMLVLSICLFLCACDPVSYSVNRDEINDAISVELIQYQNPKQKHFSTWVANQYDKLKPFVFANATVLETLPEENISDFLDSFSNTDILQKYYAYDSPKDVCIRITYANSDFLIIWANYSENSFSGYIGEYSADGTVLSFWGSFSSVSCYTNLVDQYFSYDLE